MEKLNVRNTQLYVLGVSGGPDSMALFDMCIKQGIKVVAVHMNYQKRDSSNRDMAIVRDYCDKYGIAFEYRMQNKQCIGNFQAFARQERYAFYKEMVQKYHASGVLLAHHRDDHLETYLMQKQRESIGVYYGIQKETVVMDCCIIRPLLGVGKQELEAYCKENEVPYGIDESNLSNAYARNKIRHEIIERMSGQEKEELALEIEDENLKLQNQRKETQKFLDVWDGNIDCLQGFDPYELQQILFQWIDGCCHCHLSGSQIRELADFVQSKAKNWTKDIQRQYSIYSEYGKLCIDSNEDQSYAYIYPQCRYQKTPYFEISPQGSSVEAVTLQDSDFPITIRSAKPGDEIRLRFGTKKLNRWFIDRKIPKKERKTWPVVMNALGNIILVPKIGCDIEHFSNNPTLFVLK